MNYKGKPGKKPFNSSIERERIDFLRCKNAPKPYQGNRMSSFNKENFQRNIQSLAKIGINKEPKRDLKAEEKFEEEKAEEPVIQRQIQSPVKELIQKKEVMIQKEMEVERPLKKDNDSEIPFNLNQKVSGNWLQKYSPYRQSHINISKSPMKSPIKSSVKSPVKTQMKSPQKSPSKSPYKSPNKSRYKEIVEINYPKESEDCILRRQSQEEIMEDAYQKPVEEPKENYVEQSRFLDCKSAEVSVEDVKMTEAHEDKPIINELAPIHQESFGIEEQIYSPDKSHQNSNDQIDQKEKSSSDSAYKDFLSHREDIQYSDEKHNMFTDKYSSQSIPQKEQVYHEENKEFDYDKYNKSAHEASNSLYELYKKKDEQLINKNESSGSQKEVSPKFNSNSYPSSSFIPNKETISPAIQNSSSHYIHKDIDFNEHSADRSESPYRSYGFVFKHKFDDKNASFGIPRLNPAGNLTQKNNIFQDAIDVPMEDVKCRKQEANDQPIYIEDTPLLEGCGVKHCDRLVLLF